MTNGESAVGLIAAIGVGLLILLGLAGSSSARGGGGGGGRSGGGGSGGVISGPGGGGGGSGGMTGGGGGDGVVRVSGPRKAGEESRTTISRGVSARTRRRDVLRETIPGQVSVPGGNIRTRDDVVSLEGSGTITRGGARPLSDKESRSEDTDPHTSSSQKPRDVLPEQVQAELPPDPDGGGFSLRRLRERRR